MAIQVQVITSNCKKCAGKFQAYFTDIPSSMTEYAADCPKCGAVNLLSNVDTIGFFGDKPDGAAKAYRK